MCVYIYIYIYMYIYVYIGIQYHSDVFLWYILLSAIAVWENGTILVAILGMAPIAVSRRQVLTLPCTSTSLKTSCSRTFGCKRPPITVVWNSKASF